MNPIHGENTTTYHDTLNLILVFFNKFCCLLYLKKNYFPSVKYNHLKKFKKNHKDFEITKLEIEKQQQ